MTVSIRMETYEAGLQELYERMCNNDGCQGAGEEMARVLLQQCTSESKNADLQTGHLLSGYFAVQDPTTARATQSWIQETSI